MVCLRIGSCKLGAQTSCLPGVVGTQFTFPFVVARVEADRMSALPAHRTPDGRGSTPSSASVVKESIDYQINMNSVAAQVDEFRRTLWTNERRFDVELTEDSVGRLCNYYELVFAWNTRLHLVGP